MSAKFPCGHPKRPKTMSLDRHRYTSRRTGLTKEYTYERCRMCEAARASGWRAAKGVRA